MMTISFFVGFLVPIFEIATVRAKFAVSRLTFSAAFKADLFTVTLFGFFGGMGFLCIRLWLIRNFMFRSHGLLKIWQISLQSW